MANILLSYAQDDIRSAEHLVHRINQLGWDVRCDRDLSLVARNPYSDEITSQLNQAKCVLVLWTKHSVMKSWIRSEARLGLISRKLVQITDGVAKFNLPPPFFEFVSGDLTEWQGALDHPGFQHLIAGGTYLCGHQGVQVADGLPVPQHPVSDRWVGTQPDIGWRPLGSIAVGHDENDHIEKLSRNDIPVRRTPSEQGALNLDLPHHKFARELDRLAPVLEKGALDDGDERAIRLLRQVHLRSGSADESSAEPPQLRLPEVQPPKNRRLLDAQDQIDTDRSRPLSS